MIAELKPKGQPFCVCVCIVGGKGKGQSLLKMEDGRGSQNSSGETCRAHECLIP